MQLKIAPLLHNIGSARFANWANSLSERIPAGEIVRPHDSVHYGHWSPRLTRSVSRANTLHPIRDPLYKLKWIAIITSLSIRLQHALHKSTNVY